MTIKSQQSAQRFFITGVSLITSNGPQGQNVMAAEWTMQISYKPMLLAVFIHGGASTLANIKRTKQFGVNVASEKQAMLVSVAGGYSRREVNKLKIRRLFSVSESRRTGLPLIDGCVINAECELFTIKKIGDHFMVVGKVLSIMHDETKKPLLYHRNRYFKIGKKIEPVRHTVQVNKKTLDAFTQKQNNFILKYVGTLVRSKNRVLVLNDAKQCATNTIPCIQPRKGKDNKKELENYLQNKKLKILLKEEPTIKRLVIKNKNNSQRINFILFDGVLKNESESHMWKVTKSNSFLQSLIR